MNKIHCIITVLFTLTGIVKTVRGQNLNFAGAAPSVSFSVAANKKFDVNLVTIPLMATGVSVSAGSGISFAKAYRFPVRLWRDFRIYFKKTAEIVFVFVSQFVSYFFDVFICEV